VNAVICANEAWYTEEPGRLRVLRARAGYPSFRARVRVGMESCDDDGVRHDRRSAQIQRRLCTRGRAAYHKYAGRLIHVNPTPLFMAVHRVSGK
jgi:hypothetical protein